MLVIVLARQKGGFGMSSVFSLVGGFVLLLAAKVMRGGLYELSALFDNWILNPRKRLLGAQQDRE